MCVCIFFYLSISGVRVAMMTMPLHSYTVYLWVCDRSVRIPFFASTNNGQHGHDFVHSEKSINMCIRMQWKFTHAHTCLRKKCVKMKSVNALLSASPLFETVVCAHNKHKKNQEKWATVAENNTKWFQQTKKLDFFSDSRILFLPTPFPLPHPSISVCVCVFASS